MKEETVDQIKEFTLTLDRLNKGDVTLNSKISSMRSVCCVIETARPSPFVFCISINFQVNFIDHTEYHRIIIQYGRNDSNIWRPEFG